MGLGGLMAAIPTRRRLEASAALRVAEEAG